MVDLLVFPDLEAVASYTIRNASIPGLTGSYSSIPAKNPVFPLAVVKRVGGFPANRRRLDMARIQVDIWGGAPNDGAGAPTKSTIHDIAQLARVALMRMAGQHFTTPVQAYVTDVRDSLGLAWAPDPVTNRDRYLFSVNVYGSSPPA
jgi:hypothetical protein